MAPAYYLRSIVTHTDKNQSYLWGEEFHRIIMSTKTNALSCMNPHRSSNVSFRTLLLLSIGTMQLIVHVGCIDSLSKRKAISENVRKIANDARDPNKQNESLQTLLKMARGRYSFGATVAAAALGTLGESARPVVPDIAKLMNSSDPYVAREAARSLLNLGPISETAIPELEKQVAFGAGGDVTWFAAEALGAIGAPAARSLPVLRKRLKAFTEEARKRGGERPADILPDSLRKSIQKLEIFETEVSEGASRRTTSFAG